MSLAHRLVSVRRSLLTALICAALPGTFAYAQSCSAPWPGVHPVFTSRIEYGDRGRKSDPYIAVRINGKLAKMLLDTGSNAHVIWDARLLGEGGDNATHETQTLDAIASSTQAKGALLTLDDATGNEHLQRFYVIAETPLMADGFSGIISPQSLAQEKVSVLNFKDDCFFVSDRFDPEAGGRYRTEAVGAIPNSDRVMGIPLDVPGGRVPVVVDSGAYRTTLLGSLMHSAPVGRDRTTNVDLLGNVIVGKRRTRLVDITINGRHAPRHPVVPASAISEKGIVSLGAVGMDLLAGNVIFHDGDRNRFAFVETAGRVEVSQ